MTQPAPVAIATTDIGSGPSIVFTHGWADDRGVWDGLIAELGTTVRSVSWDLRGHGGSGVAPPGHYSRAHALADMASVVNAVDPPVVLVGHSLGGYLSLAYTLLHPDEVRALVLIAAGPGFRKEETRQQWNDSVDASAAKLDLPEGSEEISKHVDSWIIDSLGEISVPTLVIVGEHDKRFHASAAVFEKNLDVRANLVVPDAGHGVHRKKPAEIATAMRAFLHGLD